MNTPAAWCGPLAHADIRFLAEVGFLAAQRGQAPQARKIFEALLVLRPERTLPYIGLAMASAVAGQPDEAVRILRDEGLRAHPDDGELTAFLGMALHEAGRTAEAAAVLGALILREQGETPHLRLAKRVLALTAPGALPAPPSLQRRTHWASLA